MWICRRCLMKSCMLPGPLLADDRLGHVDATASPWTRASPGSRPRRPTCGAAGRPPPAAGRPSRPAWAGAARAGGAAPTAGARRRRSAVPAAVHRDGPAAGHADARLVERARRPRDGARLGSTSPETITTMGSAALRDAEVDGGRLAGAHGLDVEADAAGSVGRGTRARRAPCRRVHALATTMISPTIGLLEQPLEQTRRCCRRRCASGGSRSRPGRRRADHAGAATQSLTGSARAIGRSADDVRPVNGSTEGFCRICLHCSCARGSGVPNYPRGRVNVHETPVEPVGSVRTLRFPSEPDEVAIFGPMHTARTPGMHRAIAASAAITAFGVDRPGVDGHRGRGRRRGWRHALVARCGHRHRRRGGAGVRAVAGVATGRARSRRAIPRASARSRPRPERRRCRPICARS